MYVMYPVCKSSAHTTRVPQGPMALFLCLSPDFVCFVSTTSIGRIDIGRVSSEPEGLSGNDIGRMLLRAKSLEVSIDIGLLPCVGDSQFSPKPKEQQQLDNTADGDEA